jgi:hypothetical protein
MGLVIIYRTEAGVFLRDVSTSVHAVVTSMDADNACPQQTIAAEDQTSSSSRLRPR